MSMKHEKTILVLHARQFQSIALSCFFRTYKINDFIDLKSKIWIVIEHNTK